MPRRKKAAAVENRCRYCWKPIPLHPEGSEPKWRRRWTSVERVEVETYDARVPLKYCCDEHKRADARTSSSTKVDDLTRRAIELGVTAMDRGLVIEQPAML